MAKRPAPNIELPSDETEVALPPPQSEVAAPPPAPEPAVSEIVVGLPSVDGELSGFVSKHVEVNLTAAQSQTLWRITKAMDIRGERLNNGKRVITKVDTIRRILELAEAQ